jgi:hypothetical protein
MIACKRVSGVARFGFVLLAVAAITGMALEYACADEPAAPGDAQLKKDTRKSEQGVLLATMAKNGYSLQTGQNLRRIPPPFIPERAEYYHVRHPGQAQAIPNGAAAMVFHYRGKTLDGWGMTFGGGGYTLRGVLDALLGIKTQTIEGGDVLDRAIPGDWVLRPGAKQDDVLKELETLVNQELSLRVRIEWTEIERPVYVARGSFEFTPIEGGRAGEKLVTAVKTFVTIPIEIYGPALVPNSGAGGGSGKFDELLQWLGRWIDKPIVSELKEPPTNQFSWHLHEPRFSTAQARAEARDPALVLPNITAQTGLKFDLEQRKVKTLLVVEKPE